MNFMPSNESVATNYLQLPLPPLHSFLWQQIWLLKPSEVVRQIRFVSQTEKAHKNKSKYVNA